MIAGVVKDRTSKLEELKRIWANKPEAPASKYSGASLTVYKEDFEDLFNIISSEIGEVTETPTSGNPDNEILKMFINDDNTHDLNFHDVVSVLHNLSGSNDSSNTFLRSKTVDAIVRKVQKALMAHQKNSSSMREVRRSEITSASVTLSTKWEVTRNVSI